MKRAAVSWSGGKDSYMALKRALERGLDVVYTIHMFVEDLYSYHGPPEILYIQQAALGVRGLFARTTWAEYERDFRKALEVLRRDGIETVVFGDIFIEDHRRWVERVCRETGLEALEPLWGEDTARLVREAVDSGVKALVVRVIDREPLTEYVGRLVDREFIERLVESGLDPAGEYGEYHTVVLDAPLFRIGVEVLEGRVETVESVFSGRTQRYRVYIPTRYRIYQKRGL